MARFKQVAGYEERYLVTDEGDVYSLPFMVDCPKGKWLKEGRKLRSATTKDGYKTVVLTVDGVSKTVKVHRIVAAAFIDNPLHLPEVNHIDENKSNNRADNLEWCSHQYNIEYSLNKPIAQYKLDGEKIAEYKSIVYAEKMTGIKRRAITNALKGWSKSAGGYCWKYC